MVWKEIGKGVKGWSLEVAKYIDPSIELKEKNGLAVFYQNRRGDG